MTFTPIKPKLIIRNISKSDVNILGVKIRPGQQKDIYEELEYNDGGSLAVTILKELESPSGKIYHLWKVLDVIRIIECVNPTYFGSGLSAQSITASNDYFEGAVLGYEGGSLKWLSAGGGGAVSGVTATSPLASSGGSAPDISFSGWPSDGSGALTNDGYGSLSWVAPPTLIDKADGIAYNDALVSPPLSANNLQDALDTIKSSTVAGDLSGNLFAPSVTAIRGNSVSSLSPIAGQVLTWSGSAWVPGANASGGSGGGGGVTYFLDAASSAQAPSSGLPSSPHSTKALSLVSNAADTVFTSNTLSTGGIYDYVAGFLSAVGTPGITDIPAGIWDFNVWASSDVDPTGTSYMRAKVYKYDGTTATLLTTSEPTPIYNPGAVTQYVCSVVLSPTSLLSSDRIYVELEATCTNTGHTVSFHFGDGHPSHVLTTITGISGTGLVHVIDGVMQSVASPVDVGAGSSEVIGILPVENGGTGASSLTINSVILGNNTSTVQTVSPGASGNVLTSNGTTWTSAPAPATGVTSVTASSPISSSGGSTPNLTLGTVGVPNGGTGITSYTIGDLIFASGASSLSRLADVATGNALLSGGVGTAPSWGQVGLTTHVTGTLPVGNGGTGLTAPGSSGNVLTSNGTSWTSSAPTGGSPSGAAGGDLTGSTYPNPIISSFGGKIHWVVQGGKYATLQAAVDAAAANDVILVGPAPTGAPQNGTWGNITIPAQKKLSIVGLNGGQVSTAINIGLVTYSPTTGLNINENEVFLCGLFINANYAGNSGVTFSGTAPARLRLKGCFLYNSGTSGDGVLVSNSASTSSLYLDNCTVQTGSNNTTSVLVNHQAGYTSIKNGCDISGGGQYALRIAGGTVEASDAIFEIPALVTGTVSAVTNTTLTDASKNWVVNAYAGMKVYISSGTGAGQSRTIISNTATTLTISTGATNWSPNPSAGIPASTYSIGTPRETVRMDGGSASIYYCTIRAPIGDATGINLAGSGTVLGINNASLSVASGGATAGTGTGYAINGISGTFLIYGQIAYSNSIIIPYNVKVKNAITAAAVTQAFTSSP